MKNGLFSPDVTKDIGQKKRNIFSTNNFLKTL